MKAWFFPRGLANPVTEFKTVGSLRVEVPQVTAALAGGIAERLAGAQKVLLEMKTETLLRGMEEVLAEWAAGSSDERKAAQEAFCAAAGTSPATSPFGPLLESVGGTALREWVKAEVNPYEALDGFVKVKGGGMQRAMGPELCVHVLSGNVPLIWLPAFLACVLMRSPCLLKPAARDPVTPALFVQSLAARIPALLETVAVLPWEGGADAVERAVFGAAQAVIAYGSGPSIAGVRRNLGAETAFLAHGPRAAAGVISREAAGPGKLEQLASLAARDALLYDQRGCLSLSALFVEEGGLYEPQEAAAELAKAMEKASAALPAGQLPAGTAAMTQAWRGRIRARALAGGNTALFASRGGLDWTVIYDEKMPPCAQDLARTVWVSPLRRLDDVPDRIRAWGKRVHAVCFAGPAEKGIALAEMLAPGGLERFVDFGRLQAPGLAWPHGGGSPFRSLLRMTRVGD